MWILDSREKEKSGEGREKEKGARTERERANNRQIGKKRFVFVLGNLTIPPSTGAGDILD